jgi:hypothetical protein
MAEGFGRYWDRHDQEVPVEGYENGGTGKNLEVQINTLANNAKYYQRANNGRAETTVITQIISRPNIKLSHRMMRQMQTEVRTWSGNSLKEGRDLIIVQLAKRHTKVYRSYCFLLE